MREPPNAKGKEEKLEKNERKMDYSKRAIQEGTHCTTIGTREALAQKA